jgi:hypothetical protein
MKEIKFNNQADFADIPRPAKNFIPDWYKKAPRFTDGKDYNILNGQANLGLKMCSPFLDSLTSGYMVTLNQDLWVEKTGLGTSIKWRIVPGYELPVGERSSSSTGSDFPIPAGHSKQHFIWSTSHQMKTPKGYSLLISHPFNRFDLPFTTCTGIVDADAISMNRGNIPFFIKEDFEGLIPSDTPIMQVLPFKRENWKSIEDKSLFHEGKKAEVLSKLPVYGWYKKNIWVKKNYE